MNNTIVPNPSNSVTPANFYKPSELLGIFINFFSNKEVNATVVCLQGIYWKSDKVYGSSYYDRLKDQDTVDEITLIVPSRLRENLKNGNLITVYGTITRKIQQNTGSIQILLNVTRINKVKEIAISDEEVKRTEFRRIKSERGYKNVDAILESKLFAEKRPKVVLIYAESSITQADFKKGLAAAESHIDFLEVRVNFSNPTLLSSTLKKTDLEENDVIAIVRGGGSGLEKIDDVSVVESLTNLNTPWIYGVGHEKENLFIRNIADKVIPIPHALGTYFRDLVEQVVEKRNNSRAVLVEEVKKQYSKQIEDSNKKNQELTKQLESLQKTNKEQVDASNKQIANLTKAQKDAQLQLKEQTEILKKSHNEAIKQASEQIAAGKKSNEELQKQISKQTKTLEDFHVQQKKQQDDFNKNLTTMQESNKTLQLSLNNVTEKSAKTDKLLQDATNNVKQLEEQLQNKNSLQKTNWLAVFIAILISVIVTLFFTQIL